MFQKVNPKQSFPKLEEEIMNFWKENDTFKKSISTRATAEEFNFYDGPPFATGTPHYGHILAGTIKDVIPRYQTMLGKKVERNFGWDCHGLPIENIVEKKLEISGKDDIENKIGVYQFNETCRANVFGYVDDWKKTVERMGRWVDMENDYKTMDTNFMESVWRVFKNIYDKGLIYEGNRVVPYCPRCTTPLSNFEVNQGYKDKQSKTVTVKFKVKGNDNKYILAWTTTPWTLYANLGLAVGADIDYVELLDKTSGDTYILAKEKVKDHYKKEEDYSIIREYKGACLVGIKYEPIFDDFDLQINEMNKDLGTGIRLGKNAWSVVIGHHVTTETGTGIVHIAPAYGEDDFIIGEKENLGFVAHIDNSGKTYNLLENNGIFVFDFNEMVVSELKEKKLSLHIGTIDHSYPHCWRCDTPLIYRGISAWYVAVEKIRDKMVANNQKINWVPEVIKDGRFGKWLEQARDWNISRNRYWGSALPIWQSEDKKEEVCIGSIEELYEANKEFGQITKVILVRHRESEKNVLKINDSNNKYGLSEKGKKDVEILSNKLEKENIDIIYSSPFNRCIDTIKSTAEKKGLKIITDDRLKEINVGNLDGLGETWITKFDNEKLGGGESPIECYNRIKDFLYEIIKNNKGKTIAICGHGEPLLYAKKIIKDFDFYNLEKKAKIYPSKENYDVVYVYSDTLQEVDLHKHFVDEIFVKNSKTGNTLKRIPEVLDCWFESGAMPYASKHYPFENSDNFKFPADFIAEGLDQTRGWFYTLLILGTALFDNTPFLNCIVNGIVLAEDGKKMSKRLQNYPEPAKIFDNYGADAMRFYLMNSPVVEAQDLRFTEGGVEEVVKKVILPLWNTYSFFTTYANIDNFEPNKGNIFYSRHGETENNAKKVMNGGDVDTILTKKGESQATLAGKNFKLSGEKIDIIITSPRIRAKNTAELIAKEIGFNGEIIEDDRLIEQYAGVFSGLSHEQIREIAKKEYGFDLKTTAETREFFKNGNYNKKEDIKDFANRVTECLKEIQDKYKGKNVLIVAHSGTYRPINRFLNNLDFDEAIYDLPSIPNATIFKMPVNRSNILDKWIISELNKLILEVSTNLDNYKINEAARPIVAFMDNLTNWYIRRSRKRFWANGMERDKVEAYETLYEVLVELTKVLAPFMPYVSEYIYKNLTQKESVHLDVFPTANKSFILDNLNNSFDKTAKNINLGLACRERNRLRVRQPLKSIKISETLESYYIDMIKDELNVKEVLYFTEQEMPKKICKPNARLIGPKFGSDVKFIISEAKAGNFEELEGGKVKVGDFILEEGEYEIAFEKSEGIGDLEAGFGMVVSLDTNLTTELIQEGLARDLIRHIQESRKEANFNVDDRIQISIKGGNEIENILINFKDYIQSETLSTIIENLEKSDFEKEIELEEEKIILNLKR